MKLFPHVAFMRTLVFILFLGVAVMLAPAQANRKNNPPISSDNASSQNTFQLGARRVTIPAPDGFMNAFAKFDVIANRFIATEYPGNETLAVHVPLEMADRIAKGENPQLDFYTKVFVSNKAKAVDLTEKQFADVAAAYEALARQMLDPNGAVLKTTIANAQKGLSELSGKDVHLEFLEPKVLGYFEKKNNVFSTMIFMVIKLDNRSIPLLSASSLVYLNKRLVFVTAYRVMSSEKDVSILQEFSKNWTAKIIAANQ